MGPQQEPNWRLDEALRLVRHLSPILLEAGWGIGLTGSVLLTGKSYNDVDIIVYPQNDGKIDRESLYQALIQGGLDQRFTVGEVHRAWHQQGSSDCKHVEVWSVRDPDVMPKAARVDVFILQ